MNSTHIKKANLAYLDKVKDTAPGEPKYRTWYHGGFESWKKGQSPIWDYFEYDCVSDKSKCLVENDNTADKGKNPTNLKVHLNSTHKKANLAYLDKVKDTAPGEPPSPETDANSRPGSRRRNP